jgi:hypothetical protein
LLSIELLPLFSQQGHLANYSGGLCGNYFKKTREYFYLFLSYAVTLDFIIIQDNNEHPGNYCLP